MGMDIGQPDLVLSCRNGYGIYCVLYLELKTKAGRLGENQIIWNEDFDKNFSASNCERNVAYGFSEAKQIIIAWLTKTI